MHSFIICSGSKQKRLSTILDTINKLRQKKPPTKTNIIALLQKEQDLQILEPSPLSIGIQSIRELKNNLILKPFFEKQKIAVIISAHTLTLQAQHALLKTLEEPTPNTFIFLETENPNTLLPTILSRCQIKRLGITSIDKSETNHQLKLLQAMMSPSLGKRMLVTKQFRSREEAEKFLTNTLTMFRNKKNKDKQWLETIKLISRALSDLKANINYKLAIEHLVLSLPINSEIDKT